MIMFNSWDDEFYFKAISIPYNLTKEIQYTENKLYIGILRHFTSQLNFFLKIYVSIYQKSRYKVHEFKLPKTDFIISAICIYYVHRFISMKIRFDNSY